MSKQRLSYLDSVQFVKGVWSKRAKALQKAGIETVIDLLRYYPRKWLDRSNIKRFAELREGEKVSAIGRVVSFGVLRGRRKVFEVLLSDGEAYLTLTWFHGIQYIQKKFKRDDVLAVSGTVSSFNGPQLIHPDFEFLEEGDDVRDLIHSGRIIPLYSSSTELKRFSFDSRGFRRVMKAAIESCADSIIDYLPTRIIVENNLLPLQEALRKIHFPDSMEELRAARERLVFDELFLLELTLALGKANIIRRRKNHSYAPPSSLLADYYHILPFELTSAQNKALAKIIEDMQRPYPMHRLLMGEVGSGKTAVALGAMLYAIENGCQAAIMAPTGLLAEQHYTSIREYAEKLNINTVLLTGSITEKRRLELYERISDGSVGIIVGTHALISEPVQYKNLALAIVVKTLRKNILMTRRLRCQDILAAGVVCIFSRYLITDFDCEHGRKVK